MLTSWNFIDVAFGIVLLFSLVGGFLKGFTWQLVRIVFLVAAFVLANAYCEWLGIRMRDLTGDRIGPPVDKAVGYLVIFAVVYLGSWPVAMLLRSAIAKLKLRSFDRLLGGVLGLAKGAAVCYVAFLMMAFLVPKAYPDGSRLEDQIQGSFSHRAVARVDPVVHGVLPPEFHELVADLKSRVERTIEGEEPGAVPPSPSRKEPPPPRKRKDERPI